MIQRIERQFAGRTLSLEIGRMAKLAQGSCLVQYGDTVVLCTATVQDGPTHLPFFPLTVEYREKSYAAGKIPGGFFKREGRPGEKEILSARQIDRPIRPLFPDGFMHETQVACFILSADQENDADVLALLGASVALKHVQDPVQHRGRGACGSGASRGTGCSTPRSSSSSTRTSTSWSPGTERRHHHGRGWRDRGLGGRDPRGTRRSRTRPSRSSAPSRRSCSRAIDVPDMEWTPDRSRTPDLKKRVEGMAAAKVAEALGPAATSRSGSRPWPRCARTSSSALERRGRLVADQEKDVGEILRAIEKKTMRRQILDRGRARGRSWARRDPADHVRGRGAAPDARLRALHARPDAGSRRGDARAPSRDEQRIDSIDVREEVTKSFMLHYNFPPFTWVRRGPSAARPGVRSVTGIWPSAPCSRCCRPTTSSRTRSGSSPTSSSRTARRRWRRSARRPCRSWTRVCPIKAACAGVAMGLIKEGDEVAVLTDILGLEDALGDMDFKVAGTRDGVTSIQMDIKIEGLTIEIMQEALERAHKGRMHILDVMDQTLAERPERPVALRAADHLDPDQPREDRRDHRTEGQDDPCHPGGVRRADRHRRLRTREDRGRVRRGRRARPRDDRGHREGSGGRPHLRGPGEEHDHLRRLHRDHARAPRGSATSPSCRKAASRRPRTSSRRATSPG